MNEAVKRLERNLGLDLVGIISEKISGSDLHSILLEISKKRLCHLGPSDLASNPASKPCSLDARLINSLDTIAYNTAAQFEAVELAPLLPLGAVSYLTGLDQGNVLGTIRNFECLSDPTIGLALHSAACRKSPSIRVNTNRYCTSARVLRFPIPKQEGYTAHFKLFSLVSAGRNTAGNSFAISALREHVEFYLNLFNKLKESDFHFENTKVEISDTRIVEHLCQTANINRDDIRSRVRAKDSNSSIALLEEYSDIWPSNCTYNELQSYNLPQQLIKQLELLEEKIIAPIKEQYKNTQVQLNLHRLTGLGYYSGPCFHLKSTNKEGNEFMLADGGMVNWTQTLLNDKKEHLMTSAIGTELLCRIFHVNHS